MEYVSQQPDVRFNLQPENLAQALQAEAAIRQLFAAVALESHRRRHLNDVAPVLAPNSIVAMPYVDQDMQTLHCLFETAVDLAAPGRTAVETADVRFVVERDKTGTPMYAFDDSGHMLLSLAPAYAFTLQSIGLVLAQMSRSPDTFDG